MHTGVHSTRQAHEIFILQSIIALDTHIKVVRHKKCLKAGNSLISGDLLFKTQFWGSGGLRS